MNYSQICINRSSTVTEALRQLSNTAKGILLIEGEENILFGTLTDGDIRRHLLSGGSLDDAIDTVANRNPRVAYDLTSAAQMYDSRSYKAIPVVDSIGHIKDIYIGDESNDNDCKGYIGIPVVINAGGKGTRLDPYTKVLPKPLIPVGDSPIMEHIFREFKRYACDDFHVIVNYKKEIMKAYFADNDKKYNITWYDEEKPLGTGGGLSFLKDKMDGTFFFTNCDILLKADYEEMVRFHREHDNLITMICAYKTVSVPYGVIEMGLNGRIERMKEKPEFSFLTNTGVYILEPEVLEYIEDDTAVGFPDIVEKVKNAGEKVAAYPISENEWYDMGQLPELERMRAQLFES